MLVLALLAWTFTGPAVALEDFEEDPDRSCSACPQQSDTLVDPQDLDRPDFSQVFSLYVNWDYESAEQTDWDIADLQAFVDFVMPDSVATSTPWESIAHRTAFYFGNDEAAAYAAIKFPRSGTNPLQYYEDFSITLRKVSSAELVSCASANCVACQFDSWDPPVTQIAHDNFAHEFGHLADNSIRGSGCPTYGDAYTEFPAMSSEYYNGYFDCTLQDDGHYQVSLGGFDWESSHNGLNTNSNRRGIIRAFTLYLQEHFRGEEEHGAEDLLYAWIHSEDCTYPAFGPHDWAQLAEASGSQYFAGYFSSTGGNARLRELYQEYALSMWVNDNGLEGVGEDAVWDTGAANEPQELRFFSGEDGGYGCNTEAMDWPWDAARVRPLTNVVDTTARFWRDRISYLDIYTEEDEWEQYLCGDLDVYPRKPSLTRPLAFETYGMFIMPFVSDEELDADAGGYNLHVEVVLQDSLYTRCGDNYDDPEFEVTDWPDTDNDVLHFWVLGYPAAESLKEDLDQHGEDAVLLGQRSYPSDSLYVDKEIELIVPGFAKTYSAVVIVATLTEETASSGVLDVNTIPFLYKFWAEKDLEVNALTDFVYADTLRVHGEITVPAGVALEFDEDTVFALAEHNLLAQDLVGFVVAGELTLAGQSGDPVILRPMMAGDAWTGFTVASGGTLNLDYVDAEGMDRVYCASGADVVDIWNSAFDLAGSAVGFECLAADSVLIDDCVIVDATTVRLGDHFLSDTEIHQATSTSATAIRIDGDARLDNVLVYSARTAIKCEGGEPALTDVSANSASIMSCTSSPTYGLLAVSSADVTASNCTFDGFCKAIRLDDTAQVTLRNSAIVDAVDIGVYVDDRNPIADLGYLFSPPDSSTEGRNCIATADPYDLRVFNRGVNTVLAAKNYWDTATPTSSLFGGSVAWTSYLTSCPGGSGGPGLSIIASPVALAEPLRLGPPVPNPFNPSCELRFSLPATGASTSLAVYDLSGRRLVTLFSGRADGHEHNLRWDGRDAEGHAMSSGVYFARLQVGAETQSRKLVVLK